MGDKHDLERGLEEFCEYKMGPHHQDECSMMAKKYTPWMIHKFGGVPMNEEHFWDAYYFVRAGVASGKLSENDAPSIDLLDEVSDSTDLIYGHVIHKGHCWELHTDNRAVAEAINKKLSDRGIDLEHGKCGAGWTDKVH